MDHEDPVPSLLPPYRVLKEIQFESLSDLGIELGLVTDGCRTTGTILNKLNSFPKPTDLDQHTKEYLVRICEIFGVQATPGLHKRDLIPMLESFSQKIRDSHAQVIISWLERHSVPVSPRTVTENEDLMSEDNHSDEVETGTIESNHFGTGD